MTGSLRIALSIAMAAFAFNLRAARQVARIAVMPNKTIVDAKEPVLILFNCASMFSEEFVKASNIPSSLGRTKAVKISTTAAGNLNKRRNDAGRNSMKADIILFTQTMHSLLSSFLPLQSALAVCERKFYRLLKG